VGGHIHYINISQTQTLIPAEKQAMEPMVLPNLELLGIVNQFLILLGFPHCNRFNGARKMKMLCITSSKKVVSPWGCSSF
jgi:hypothetical protein